MDGEFPVTGAPSIWELGLRVDARGPFVVSGNGSGEDPQALTRWHQ